MCFSAEYGLHCFLYVFLPRAFLHAPLQIAILHLITSCARLHSNLKQHHTTFCILWVGTFFLNSQRSFVTFFTFVYDKTVKTWIMSWESFTIDSWMDYCGTKSDVIKTLAFIRLACLHSSRNEDKTLVSVKAWEFDGKEKFKLPRGRYFSMGQVSTDT